jgi:predicted dienelactone hydrolase
MSKTRATLGSTGIFAETPASSTAPDPSPGRQGRTAAPVAATPTVARPDREGRVPLPFWTTSPAKKQLRLMAAEADTTQQELMTQALNLLFVQHGKPPIA